MIAGNLPHFGNFPVGLGTFQTGWKLSKLAGIFQDWLEIFQLYLAVYKALLSCAGLYWVCTRVVESDFRKSNKSRMPKLF